MRSITRNDTVAVASFIDPDDRLNNTSNNAHFDSILAARVSRRSVFKGAVGSGAAAILGSISVAACGGSDTAPAAVTPGPTPTPPAPPAPPLLSFNPVAKNLLDTITVPVGYTASVLYRCGDPLTAGLAAYKNDGTDLDMDKRSGDCHDGVEYFGLSPIGLPDPNSSTRAILAMNHEYMMPMWLHASGQTSPGSGARPASEVDKEVAVHGNSLVEVRLNASNGKWEYVQGSVFNRRITASTRMEIAGPLRGNSALFTKYSAAGTATRGTQNNCGTGYSFWGTFLTAEENWAGYFARSATDNSKRSAKELVSLARYGMAQGTNGRYNWAAAGSDDAYARWNASVSGTSTDGSDDYRNIGNTFGYVVEIDPYDPTIAPKKRSALGRFAHEAAVMATPEVGKPVTVYSGDDSRNEYIYKFVSNALWSAADATAANRMAVGDKFLDNGTLYAAKFAADGTGTWLPLTIANPAIGAFAAYRFADQADVLLNARLAADAAGATKMDRPEWGAINPANGEVYFTMTNNSTRTAATADSANPRAYTDMKGATAQNGNVNGHVLRFAEAAGNAAALTFKWDVYLFGAEAGADAAKVNLSGLTADNDFSSPDGLWFSPKTKLAWIQTDDGAYTDVTNCMLLAGKAGVVGDGAKVTLSYDVAGTAKTVDTFVGKKPAAGDLKRFLVGPPDAEVTGIAESPDGKAIFVNIQHPGEDTLAANLADSSKWNSYWPDGNKSAASAPKRPRSATIVITKNDGGVVGT